MQKNDNLNMLEAVVQNTEMGKNTLAQILPMAGDPLFRAELLRQRNGYHMCVGCGRCDDICPEYISFSHCVNKLGDAMKEVTK